MLLIHMQWADLIFTETSEPNFYLVNNPFLILKYQFTLINNFTSAICRFIPAPFDEVLTYTITCCAIKFYSKSDQSCKE